MSLEYHIEKIHIVECPHTRGEHDEHPEALPGDTVELECTSGFVMSVDPMTRQNTIVRKRFVLAEASEPFTLHKPPAITEPKISPKRPAPKWNPPIARRHRR